MPLVNGIFIVLFMSLNKWKYFNLYPGIVFINRPVHNPREHPSVIFVKDALEGIGKKFQAIVRVPPPSVGPKDFELHHNFFRVGNLPMLFEAFRYGDKAYFLFPGFPPGRDDAEIYFDIAVNVIEGGDGGKGKKNFVHCSNPTRLDPHR